MVGRMHKYLFSSALSENSVSEKVDRPLTHCYKL